MFTPWGLFAEQMQLKSGRDRGGLVEAPGLNEMHLLCWSTLSEAASAVGGKGEHLKQQCFPDLSPSSAKIKYS